MRRPSLVTLGCLIALALAPAASAAAPLEGRWEMAGGQLELRATANGNFTSRWIQQRPGISCPAVDDQDGDMRLSGSRRSYTGSWSWSLHRSDDTCKAIGRGRLTVTVAPGGRTADLSGEAPRGYSGTESHTLRRISGDAPPALARLSGAQQAVLADALRATRPRGELVSLAAVGLFPASGLVAVPRLERLPVGFSG